MGAVVLGASAPGSDDESVPSAESILDRHIEATGGKSAHLAFESRKATGTLAVVQSGQDFEAKFEQHVKAPGYSHVVVDGEFFFQVKANNLDQAWVWMQSPLHEEIAGDGSTSLLEGVERTRALEGSQLHAAVHWRAGVAEAKNLGAVEVAGRPAYEIRITSKSGEQYSRFYDQERAWLVKSTRQIELDHVGVVDNDAFFENYKEFDGVWLPTTRRHLLTSPTLGLVSTQTWVYQTIQHNVVVPDSLFLAPDGHQR